jgi:hypothetical protein
MKYTFTKPFATLCRICGILLLSVLLIGCGHDPAPLKEAAMPSDSFHLTVQRVITDADVVVALLKIHVPHDAGISIDADGGHCGVSLLPDSPGAVVKDGQVALSASRVTRQGDDFAYIQTLIRPESSNHSFAGGPAIHPVPAATKLEAYFSISATDGDYKLDTPIEIARLDGKPVMLVVGKPLK